MSQKPEFDRAAFEGIDYLGGTWKLEDHCELVTDAKLKSFGVKAPKVLPAMSVLLGYLDAVSSCFFGCRGGDHLIEQQVFRACNRARGAIRLMRLGFYDESLMLTRANAEAANLLILFVHDTSAIDAWKRDEKWTGSPVKVRIALETKVKLLPANEARYKILSGMAAHTGAEYPPSAHNLIARPVAAGTIQDVGMLLSLNEAALQLVWISYAARYLIAVPGAVAEGIKNASIKLLAVTGGVTVDQYEEYWEKERKQLIESLAAESGDPPSED